MISVEEDSKDGARAEEKIGDAEHDAAKAVEGTVAEKDAIEDKKWPALMELPGEVRDVAAEALAALEAGDSEEMTAVRMPFEVYSSPRVLKGLAKNPKAVEKVPARFWWDNLHEDSKEDEERLRSDYAGKKLELVAARYGEHFDREEVEMWDDVVVTIRVDGGEPRDEMILGEFIRDKKDGEIYLLRWHRRQLRSQ